MHLRRLASVPGLLGLALVAGGMASLPLLHASVAAWVLLAALLVRASPPGRVLLADGLVTLALSATVTFFALQGDPVPFSVSPLLAGLLLFSTPVWLVAAERDRRARTGGSPEPSGLAAPIATGRGLALLMAFYATLLALVAGSFPPAAVGYAWLAGCATALGVAPLALLALPSNRAGRVGGAVALVGLEVALVWHAASLEVAMEQGRALPWDELRVRLAEPGSWRVLVEGIASFRFVLVTALLVAGSFALARALRRLSATIHLLGCAKLVGSIAAFGLLLLRQPLLLDPTLARGYRETASAPWSWVHARTARTEPFDEAAAASRRTRLEPPIWEPGEAEPLAGLAGRYQRRSIVLVLVESQAARLVPGLGEGAFGYVPAQPELARLAASGVLFTNYFADGLPTHTALWSILTGLPSPSGDPPGVFRAPQATRVGRVPDFLGLGYRVDWMCPASPRFDNWDQLLTLAGARWWLDNDETAGLDRRHWTSWGMPDEQLYEVALARYRSRSPAERGRGYLQALLTVSNHSPYRLPPRPDGPTFPADHLGGTRYADHAVGRFVDRLRELPPAERPIVFLTADTAQLEGLRENEPLGIHSPEAMRIPGLLLLPDGAGAGKRYEGVFAHGDLLDLLHLLVTAPTDLPPRKFLERRRAVSLGLGGTWAASADGVCVEGPLRCYAFEERWRLRPQAPEAASRLVAALRQFAAEEAALWPDGAVPDEPRDRPSVSSLDRSSPSATEAASGGASSGNDGDAKGPKS